MRPLLSLPLTIASDDRDKFHSAVTDLRRQFPTLGVALNVRSVPNTPFVYLEGQSELQLANLVDRLRHDYNIHLDAGPPAVICLETIRRTAAAEGKYIRQVGGSGNYGHVKIRLEPNAGSKAFEFINEIENDAIPKRYIKPIEEGIREAAQGGILSGCEVVDLTAALHGGSFHETDSNEMAFKIAASLAFREAAKHAHPVLLEPLMRFEFNVPEARWIVFASALRERGADVILRERNDDGNLKIWAVAPLESMLGFKSADPEATACIGYREKPFRRDGPGQAGLSLGRPRNPGPRTGSSAVDPEPDWT
jgi:elongation factor G